MKFLVLLFLSTFLFADKIEQTLIKGRPADPKEFPASVYASMGNSRCTATVVGERTLLIAAHCVKDGGTAKFKADGIDYSSTCTHSPLYSQAAWTRVKEAIEKGQVSQFTDLVNATADWALCVVNKPVANIQYEVINQDPDILKEGNELLLTGYGCTQPGGNGGNDGIYRVGEAKIIGLPSGSDNDIVTSGGQPGAALCYGDSGGPAFLINPIDKKRVVVSVNSRGNIATTSYLCSTSTSAFKGFVTSWATKNKQLVCGIHKEAKNCRGVKTEPDIFEMLSPSMKLKITIQPDAKYSVEDAKEMIQFFLNRMEKK